MARYHLSSTSGRKRNRAAICHSVAVEFWSTALCQFEDSYSRKRSGEELSTPCRAYCPVSCETSDGPNSSLHSSTETIVRPLARSSDGKKDGSIRVAIRADNLSTSRRAYPQGYARKPIYRSALFLASRRNDNHTLWLLRLPPCDHLPSPSYDRFLLDLWLSGRSRKRG